MKKVFLILFIAMAAMTNVQAQQISVVKDDGSTTLHRTLAEAIAAIEDGCVIYLPGGGFTIADDVKITKRVTIIGTGHKTVTDNVDGNTTISGNLFFNVGSSQSAIMGCYITGNVVIGEDGAVNDVLVRYCNLNSVQVKNSECQETFVNQNYIRGTSDFGSTNAEITNNILHSVIGVNNGVVSYNVFVGVHVGSVGHDMNNWPQYHDAAAIKANLSTIKNNAFSTTLSTGSCNWYYENVRGSENKIISNLTLGGAYGEKGMFIENVKWPDVYKNYNGGAINTNSDFHFNENYKDYENQVGIYAGTGFSDEQKAPTPYIIEKEIDEQTDAQGKLKIKISVKANQ